MISEIQQLANARRWAARIQEKGASAAMARLDFDRHPRLEQTERLSMTA